MLPLPLPLLLLLLLLLLLHGCRPSQALKTSSRCLALPATAGNGNRDNCAALFEMAVPHFAGMDSQVGAGHWVLAYWLLAYWVLAYWVLAYWVAVASQCKVCAAGSSRCACCSGPASMNSQVGAGLAFCVAGTAVELCSAEDVEQSTPAISLQAFLATAVCVPALLLAAPLGPLTLHLPVRSLLTAGAGHCCMDVRALPLAAQPGAAGGVGGGGVGSAQPDQLD